MGTRWARSIAQVVHDATLSAAFPRRAAGSPRDPPQSAQLAPVMEFRAG